MAAVEIAIVDMPGGGSLGLCPLPGKSGALASDLRSIAAFRPSIVLSLVEEKEWRDGEADAFASAIRFHGMRTLVFPVPDYGTPDKTAANWSVTSAAVHAALDRGERVLVHCMGGCGRSGMITLRIMTERGEVPSQALGRLRNARPCAIETDGQMIWATAGYRKGEREAPGSAENPA